MVKKQKNKAKTSPISKGTVITVAILMAAVAGGVYYLWTNSIPVNSSTPNFSPASNIYILAIHNDQGYSYDEQSTKTGKKSIAGTNTNPGIHVPKGTLIALICRDEKYFIPDGSSVLNSGDVLLVIASNQALQKLQSILNNLKDKEMP